MNNNLYELTGQPSGLVIQAGEAITCEWQADVGYPRMFAQAVIFLGGEKDAQDIKTAREGEAIANLAEWLEEHDVKLVYSSGTTPEDYEGVAARVWTTENGVTIIAPEGWC